MSGFNPFASASAPKAPPKNPNENPGDHVNPNGVQDFNTEGFEQDDEEGNPLDAMAALFASQEEPPELDDNGNPVTPPAATPAQTPAAPAEDPALANLAKQIQSIVTSSTTLTDADYPDGYDETNPDHQRQVNQTLMHKSVMGSIQASMLAMQQAMTEQSKQFESMLTTKLSELQTGQSARSQLEKLVPESTNPKYKPMIDMMFSQAMAANKNDATKAAQAIRAAFDTMGLKNKGGGSNQMDPSQGGFREGRSALDLFAPMPKS